MNLNKKKKKVIRIEKLGFNQSNIEPVTVLPPHRWKIYYQDDASFSSLSEPIDLRPKKIQIIECAAINEADMYHYLNSMDTHNKENIDHSRSQIQKQKTTVKKVSRSDLIKRIQFETYPAISLFEIEEKSSSKISYESDENEFPNYNERFVSKLSEKNMNFTSMFNYKSLKTYSRTKKLKVISNKDNNVEASTSPIESIESGSLSSDKEQIYSPKKFKLHLMRNFSIPKKNRSLSLGNQVSLIKFGVNIIC